MLATFCPVSGFLGAGKTTTLLATANALRQRNRQPAIITNDQGRELVDTQVAKTAVNAVAEVADGCFCCRFDDLAEMVTRLVDGGADVVLAEAVGSCTDLRATVVRPLRAHYGDQLRVAPLTTVVDPDRYRLFARAWDTGADSDISYLYAHQLAEADVIAVNKVDTFESRLLAPLLADIGRRFPTARVVPYSARSGQTTALLEAVCRRTGEVDRPDVELDYDRYAAAEAELAWLNHVVAVNSHDHRGFRPGHWATVALTTLSNAWVGTDVMVGHAKLTVSGAHDAGAGGLTKASITRAGESPTLDLVGVDQTGAGRAVFNLRVACPPGDLDRACAQAIAAADLACSTWSVAQAGQAAFQPAYPQPTYRIPRSS